MENREVTPEELLATMLADKIAEGFVTCAIQAHMLEVPRDVFLKAAAHAFDRVKEKSDD